jgi:hypothetical protein
MQMNITEAWYSVENWYFALVPANRLPESGDTVITVLSEYGPKVNLTYGKSTMR